MNLDMASRGRPRRRPRPRRSAGTLAGLVAALALGGCWVTAGSPAAGGPRTGSLVVHPSLGPGRVVQTVVNPYTAADVDHVVVMIFSAAGGTESAVVGDGGPLSQDVASASFGGSIVFADLVKDTSYRVRGYAYARPGTASADLLSVEDESFLDIVVTHDDRPAVATLSIQLKDKPFAAAGTGSLDIKTGGIADVGGEIIK